MLSVTTKPGMLNLDTRHHEEPEVLLYASLSYEKMIRVTRSTVYWGKHENLGSSLIDIPLVRNLNNWSIFK